MTERYLKIADATPSGDWGQNESWPGPGFYNWAGNFYVVGTAPMSVFCIGMPMGLDWQQHLTEIPPRRTQDMPAMNLRDLTILIAVAQQPELAVELLKQPDPDQAGDGDFS